MIGKATLIGRVTRCTLVSPDGKKPFASVAIEDLVGREWNGKTYHDKAEIKCYRQPEGLVQSMVLGCVVMASGTPKAETNEWQGKTYGKLTMMADDFCVVQAAGGSAAPAPATTAARPATTAAPAPQSATAPAPAQSPAAMAEDKDDSIPF